MAKTPPAVRPLPTAGALARIFDALPHTLAGSTLTVTYPSLAVYGERAQFDLSALEEIATVAASSVDLPPQSPPSGPQVLTVTLV